MRAGEAAGAKPAAPAPEKKDSRYWKEQLAREKALFERDQRLKAERAQIDAQRAALEKDLAAARQLQQQLALAREKPLEALQALGLSYDDIAAAKLNGGVAPPETKIRALEERLAGFEQQQLAARQQAQQAQQQAHLQATQAELQEHLATIAEETEANPDKYPFIATLKQGASVGRLILSHFEETGRVLSNDEAAARIEAILQEESTTALDSLAANPKLRDRVKGALQKHEPPPRPAAKPRAPPTLSNTPGGSPAPSPVRAPALSKSSRTSDWRSFHAAKEAGRRGT